MTDLLGVQHLWKMLDTYFNRARTPGAAETNVRVRGVGGRVIQVESEDTRIRGIVPVTAADKGPLLDLLSFSLEGVEDSPLRAFQKLSTFDT